MKELPVLILISFYLMSANALDGRKLCSLFKKNTKLRLPNSCQSYIECDGSSGQLVFCSDTYRYDEKKQKCVPLNESQCVNDIFNICEYVADHTPFRHENDCSKYYKCESGKLKQHECSGKYFNLETGKCVDKSTVTCIYHVATSKTCLKNNKPYVGKISDGITCRGYFDCADKGPHAHDLEPKWFQCSSEWFFDENLQTCNSPSEVKCVHNRCDGMGNLKAVSSKNSCRNYLQCQDDAVAGEYTCDEDYYFDELFQNCTNKYVIKDNGCYGGPSA